MLGLSAFKFWCTSHRLFKTSIDRIKLYCIFGVIKKVIIIIILLCTIAIVFSIIFADTGNHACTMTLVNLMLMKTTQQAR